MNELHIVKIAAELKLRPQQVLATAALLEEGSTVPFIARYRKEVTGSIDEVAIAAIRDRLEQLAELDKRREAIVKSLEERQLLTATLKARIDAADSMTVLEDIYLPFRPKRRTRATIAREKGLEPLAVRILAQDSFDPMQEAIGFLNVEKGVASVEEALAGARDISAETISEDAEARAGLRGLCETKGTIRGKVVEGKEAEGAKFKDYFDWTEPIANAPSHRVLAMRRGEAEGVLHMTVAPPDDQAVNQLEARFVKRQGPVGEQVRTAAQDAWKRLLGPSMETEMRLATKDRADAEAIRVFADNLRQLLLASPLGQKNMLALDPGFRTGCKLVCLDRQGKLLHNDVIYPNPPENDLVGSARKILELCKRHSVECIAIGNGTAGRETEAFARELAAKLPNPPSVVMVNESGASVYSASDVAREEFPDHDVTVRGAVSIGRRLMDPLAELVKIDPKSIGVGQYQHDVDPGKLKHSLDDVVVSCVNAVGVEVNTASKQLLTYVSGLGPQLAANIVQWRNENGAFHSRQDLRKVTRLGPKAFEQAAGFLRIREGDNPLDASSVHPESYSIVDRMAKDVGCTVKELMRDDALRQKIELKKYVTEKVGLPTLQDILLELAKPGRDPREKFEPVQFADGIKELKDLTPGLRLQGIVTNVTAFGAFVDVGVHQDGLVHVSQLADHFVKNPGEVVKVQQKVSVVVLDVDHERKRIALSMKSNPELGPKKADGAAPRTAPRQPSSDGPRPAPRPVPAPVSAPASTAPRAKTWMEQQLEQWEKKNGKIGSK